MILERSCAKNETTTKCFRHFVGKFTKAFTESKSGFYNSDNSVPVSSRHFEKKSTFSERGIN